jgi:hypothetical protein
LALPLAVLNLESRANAEDYLLFSLAKCYVTKGAKYGLPSKQVEPDSEFVRESNRRADLYIVDLQGEKERVRADKISVRGLEHSNSPLTHRQVQRAEDFAVEYRTKGSGIDVGLCFKRYVSAEKGNRNNRRKVPAEASIRKD